MVTKKKLHERLCKSAWPPLANRLQQMAVGFGSAEEWPDACYNATAMVAMIALPSPLLTAVTAVAGHCAAPASAEMAINILFPTAAASQQAHASQNCDSGTSPQPWAKCAVARQRNPVRVQRWRALTHRIPSIPPIPVDPMLVQRDLNQHLDTNDRRRAVLQHNAPVTADTGQ